MSSGFSEALMTTIDRNLKWRNHADDFDADEKKNSAGAVKQEMGMVDTG